HPTLKKPAEEEQGKGKRKKKPAHVTSLAANSSTSMATTVQGESRNGGAARTAV
ncbi:hypothetical protein GGF32_007869, partial [Allomyces javanicus]